jgi:hypothetical protein
VFRFFTRPSRPVRPAALRLESLDERAVPTVIVPASTGVWSEGSIPMQIGQLSGSIPTQLGQLSGNTSTQLDHLTGNIPSQLGD